MNYPLLKQLLNNYCKANETNLVKYIWKKNIIPKLAIKGKEPYLIDLFESYLV